MRNDTVNSADGIVEVKDQLEGEEKKIFRMNETVFYTGLTSFLSDTATKMIYPILPVFLTTVLGASVTSVSIIEGFAESTASVLKAVSGWWSDKIGKNKPFMIFGYLMTAIVTPLFGFVTGWYQVLFMRFVERLGKGIRTAPRDSIIAAAGGKKSNGKNFGFHKAMDNSGAIVGPFLAWLIMMLAARKHGTPTLGDYKLIFVLAAIPAVLGVITICVFIKEKKAERKESNDKIKFKDFDKRFYSFLIIAFIFSLGNSTDTLLLLRAQDVGFLAATVPLLYLVFNASSVILAVPIGMISDKLGRERIIILGYVLYSIVYFGFAFVGGKAIVILLFMLYGLYSASTDGIQKALVADIIGKKNRGTGLGLYNAVIGITLLPASIIGGALWNQFGHAAPFIFGAVLAFAAAILLIIFYRDRMKSAAV